MTFTQLSISVTNEVNTLKIYFLGFFLLILPLIGSAAQIYDTNGTASSDSKKEACLLALNYARKEALDESGVIVQSESNFNQNLVNNVNSSNFEISINERSSGVVKTLKVDEITNYDPKSGSITCAISASFEIKTREFEQVKGKDRISGELPSWVANPPNILGKRSVVSRSKSKTGAISSALFEFKSNTSFDKRVKLDDLRKVSIVNELTKNSTIQGMYKSEVNEKGIIEVVTVIKLSLAGNEVLKLFKVRDEINPTYFKENLRVLDEGGLKTIFGELTESGFELKVEEVVSDEERMWYALIIAKVGYINTEHVRQVVIKEGTKK